MLILNVGVLYYFSKNATILTAITEIEGFTIYNALYEAVTFVIPQSLGLPFVILSNMIVFNFLLCIFVIIFIYPFILVFGGGRK